MQLTVFKGADDSNHPLRILVLYGSLRSVSYLRKSVEEGARILRALGCDARMFDPTGLPLPGIDGGEQHPRVMELRDLAIWSEGMFWFSPERHRAMSGIMKLQIDWLPLSIGRVRPMQGKTLAQMQVCGGSQSFNAVNQMRMLGRWMRMVTILSQSSIPKAFLEFGDDGSLPEGVCTGVLLMLWRNWSSFRGWCAAALSIWWTAILSGGKLTPRPALGYQNCNAATWYYRY